MQDERWYDLVDRIQTQFQVDHETRQPLERGPGERHVLEFQSPMGRLKLERISRPVVLERRARYSKRANTEATEEFVYSDTESTHRVNLYRWVAGSWEEQDYRGLFG